MINKTKLKTVIKSALKSALQKPLNLQQAWQKDQEERSHYQSYLDNHSDWKDAANAYRKDKGIPEGNPIFTDYTSYARSHVENNDPTTYSDEDWVALWGLAQHADHDVALQRYVLSLIKKYKGVNWKINTYNINTAYEYLIDRININEGKEQEYGTQNVT